MLGWSILHRKPKLFETFYKSANLTDLNESSKKIKITVKITLLPQIFERNKEYKQRDSLWLNSNKD